MTDPPTTSHPLGRGFSAQYDALALLLRLSMLEYWDCCDEIAEAGEMVLESCYTPYVRRFGIVLAAAATCEATINTYLALKLPPETWSKKLEKQPTVKKWTEIVSKYVPEYSLPLDGELGATLKSLFACRDAIVHAKPQVNEGPVEVHPGNVTLWMSVDDAMIDKFYHLTPRLLDNLGQQDWSIPTMLASMMRTTLALPTRDVYRRLRRLHVLHRYRDSDKGNAPH